MADLSRDDIVKLAALARLDLSENEITEYQKELSDILGYVEQLESVNIDGLTPTNQVGGLTNVMRDDVIKDYGYAPNDLLGNVPAVADNNIKVKRMIG
jgi:aspartyl-tRNA(Asn)/glutamyl-tRNA(Gln) amidotransferase subunit C